MSRIGQKPIELPEGVEFTITGQDVKAKGSKGELTLNIHPDVAIAMEDVANDDGKSSKVIKLEARNETKIAQQVWPTMRTLVDNIIIGVSQGYTKDLEIKGVGLRANLQGNTLVMSLGFSHEVKYDVPQGIKLEVADQTKIKVIGIDKQLVGQAAANIRSYKPPEPYKGKGIRYVDEYVIRKEGKKK